MSRCVACMCVNLYQSLTRRFAPWQRDSYLPALGRLADLTALQALAADKPGARKHVERIRTLLQPASSASAPSVLPACLRPAAFPLCSCVRACSRRRSSAAERPWTTERSRRQDPRRRLAGADGRAIVLTNVNQAHACGDLQCVVGTGREDPCGHIWPPVADAGRGGAEAEQRKLRAERCAHARSAVCQRSLCAHGGLRSQLNSGREGSDCTARRCTPPCSDSSNSSSNHHNSPCR